MATDTQNGAVINGGAARPYNKSTLLGHIGNDIIEALKPLNVPSPVGGDWKKLAGKFDYSVEDVAQLELTSNPLENLYRDLMSKGCTLGDLVDQLQNLDRQDVLNNVERVTGYVVPKPVTGSGDSGAQGDSNNAINEEDLPVPTFPDESQEQGVNQEVDNHQESSAAFGISATEVPPQEYVRLDAESTKNGDEESSAAIGISEAEIPSQPYIRSEFDVTKSGDDKEENQDGIESISHSVSESDTQPIESLKSASNGKEEVELESEVHPAEETAKQLEESQSQAEPDQPEDSLTLPVEESITNEEELSNMNQEFDIPPIEEANRDETQTSSEVMENPSDVVDEDQDIVILPPEKIVAEVYIDERNQQDDQQMLTRGNKQSEPESALPKEDEEVNPSEAETDEKGDGKRVENDEEDEKTEVSLNDLAGEVSNAENMRSDIIGEQNPEPELNVTVEDEEKEDNIDPIESEGPETLGEVTNEGTVEEVSSEQSLQAEGPGNEETIADSETKPELSEVQDSEKTEESIEAESSGIFSSQSMVYALGIIAVVTLLATCMYGVRRIVKK
ncbi:uro-adherence factor A-like [Ptychodera flava]|uniref:uro-adherence factor A-like n=1 Tax=Ptychodera flava TaxID=63121 RepID=UPI00396A7138